MKRAGSLILIWGIALTTWWWIAGPGGFESVKIIWLASVLCLTMAVALVASLSLPKSAFRVSLSAPTIVIILAISYTTLRAFLTPGPGIAWLGTPTSQVTALVWIIIGLITIGIINHDWLFSDDKDLTRALNIASWGIILLTIAQQQTWFNIDWTTFDDPTRGRELFGSIGSPAQLGTVSALFFSLIIKRMRSIQYFSLLTLFALAILTALTSSTTGLLILITSVIIRLVPAKFKGFTMTAIGAILLLICIAVTIQPKYFSPLPSLEERGYIWQSSLHSWQSTPLFGFGPGHFNLAYDRNYPLERLNARALSEEQPHNLVVQILVEFGLVGLGIGLALIYTLSRTYREQDWQSSFVWFAAALFNPLSVATLSLGLLAMLDLTINSREPRLHPAKPYLIGALCASIALLVIAFAPYRATVALDRANALSAQGEFMTATNVLEKAIRQTPTQPLLYLAAAEARTNAALKNDAWLESNIVISELRVSAEEARSFVYDSMRAKIADYWQRQTGKVEFAEYRNDWSVQWQSHPRASEFRVD